MTRPADARRVRPQRVPANLTGTRPRDMTIRLLRGFVDGYVATSMFVNRDKVASPVRTDSFPVVVAGRRVEAHDENVVSLTLVAPDRGTLPAWKPGAHIDVRLPSGRLRQYSLCGDPADRSQYRIAVRRIPDGGGGSIEIHDALPVGTALTVAGPRNGFGFAAPGFGSPSHHLHFVAGGIGITPILPMARLAQRLGLDWSMTYTGRSRDSLPFLDEIETFGDRVTVRTDDVDGLPSPAGLLGERRGRTSVYCCGPSPMVSGLLDELRTDRDVEFHYERFAAAPVVDGTPFAIELARTGEVLEVPADRTALDVIREARPDFAYSCRQGFCRTCVVRVVAGEPDHRETTLTPADHAEGDMLVCVSRARGERLTLDL